MSSEDLVREANDPATAPARLAELASADRATWPALAGNPSTYDALLTWLADRDDPAVNAALTARAQAALPPVPPPAPPAAAAPPVAPVAPPVAAADETPTVVTPAFEAPAQPEPTAAPEQTAAFAAPTTEPTAVFQVPGSSEPTTTYTTAPTATETQAPPSDGRKDGNNLAIVIAMVAVVIALIAGAAYAATQLFEDDDDSFSSSSADSSKSDDADDDEDDDARDAPSIPPPTLDSDDDLPGSDLPGADLPEASSEFCSGMVSIQEKSKDLITGGTANTDLDKVQKMGEDMARAYDDLAATAPAELQADIAVMGGYFELMTNPTADSASKMSEAITEYVESAQKVSTYYAKNCL